MIWLLGGYMWLFIHRPFEVWPWLGALHVERIYMIVTITYWAIAVEKHWVRNRMNFALACFCAVLLSSWIASPYAGFGTLTVEDYFKVVVFYVLVMSSVRSENDLKLLVMLFLGAMSLYIAHSLWEYHNGRHWYKMGTMRMVGVDVTNGDPNTFAGTIVYSLPLLFPLWYEWRSAWLRWALAGYAGLATTCILLTGSRMGFVGLGALALVAVLLSPRRLAIMAALAIAAPVVWNVLPTDRQNRFLTLIDPSYGPANAQESADSRFEGWRDGVRLWKENPVLGVGPGAFGPARGYNLESHHLYGQILGELGTLGAVAFGMVVLGFLRNGLDLRRLCRQDREFSASFPARLIRSVGLAVVLLLLLGFAGHNLYRYTWLWYAAFQAIALNGLLRQRAELPAGMPLRVVGVVVSGAGELRKIAGLASTRAE